MIISTEDEAVTLNGIIRGGLSTDTIDVWQSNEQEQFIRKESVDVVGERFTIALEPHSFYSLTTTRGQKKGKALHALPRPTPFPFPYEEDFEHYEAGDAPEYFSDQKGTFEVAEVNGRKCLQQIVPFQGVIWGRRSWDHPWTLVGDSEWKDIEISCDVLVRQGAVEVGGGLTKRAPEYRFRLEPDGRWKLTRLEATQGKRSSPNNSYTLGEGLVPDFDAKQWHTMKIEASLNGSITICLNNERLLETSAPLKTVGPVYLASTYNPNCFDNLIVRPRSGEPGSTRMDRNFLPADGLRSIQPDAKRYQTVRQALKDLKAYAKAYAAIQREYEMLLDQNPAAAELKKAADARKQACAQIHPVSLSVLDELLQVASTTPWEYQQALCELTGESDFEQAQRILLKHLKGE
jgi:hypothetical protein